MGTMEKCSNIILALGIGKKKRCNKKATKEIDGRKFCDDHCSRYIIRQLFDGRVVEATELEQ